MASRGTIPVLVFTNRPEFIEGMTVTNKLRIKAGQDATRVEGFRLKGVLQKEIRAGAPGGYRFKKLSEIARRYRGLGRPSARKPISSLAIPVRYWSDMVGGMFRTSVGYQAKPVVSARGIARAGNQLSKSWLFLARILQEGFKFPAGKLDKNITYFGANARTRLHREGVHIAAHGKVKGAARYFFLRKTTKELKIPGRPILAPFWFAHRSAAGVNISRNFKLKLRGQRI